MYNTSAKNEKFTFYTDLCSTSFTVTPNKTNEFVILLNGKYSVLTQILYEPSKLDILQGASAYNMRDHRAIPCFTYQDKNDSNLVVALRKEFNLDSIILLQVRAQKR